MIVRGVDSTGDWMFGKSLQDYKSYNNAIMQCIKTRLQSFLGDCFFAVNDGVDWYNLLGSRNNSLAIQLAINACILNTEGVTGLVQSSLFVANDARTLSATYSVTTVYTGQVPVSGSSFLVSGFLATQGGDILTTQSGERITS